MNKLEISVDNLADRLSGGYDEDQPHEVWQAYATTLGSFLDVDPNLLLFKFDWEKELIPVLREKYFCLDDGRRRSRMAHQFQNPVSVLRVNSPRGKLAISVSTPEPMDDYTLPVIAAAFDMEKKFHYRAFKGYRNSLIDSRTKLPNGDGFLHYKSQLLHRSLEEKTPKQGLIIMGDLNLLHHVNKLAGNDGGDMLIQMAAKQFIEYSRTRPEGTWYVSRLNNAGDEFVLCYEGATKEEAKDIIANLEARMSSHPIPLHPLHKRNELVEVPLSVSFGWAPFNTQYDNLSEVMAEAESYIEGHKRNAHIQLKIQAPELFKYDRTQDSRKEK